MLAIRCLSYAIDALEEIQKMRKYVNVASHLKAMIANGSYMLRSVLNYELKYN